MKNKNGITLIALVITIVVLIILAGVAINLTLGENGILNKAQQAKQKQSEAESREKLELVLSNARIEKETNTSYNDDYLNNMLEAKGIIVDGDYVIVDNYNYLIDREQLVILNSLGETQIKITAEVQEYLGKNTDGKYEASLLLIVESNAGLQSVVIQNPDGTTFEMETEKVKLGKDMTVELDAEYIVTVTTKDEKTATRKIVENSEKTIGSVEEFVAFRDEVNSGLTYEGKTITLTQDLDLSSICYKVDGTITNDVSWKPIGTRSNPFKGTFDGNKNIINNLYINSTQGVQGLFGCSNGTITNVVIEKNGNVLAQSYSAAIVGSNNGTIKRCINNATIKVTGNGSGGIAGDNYGMIEECVNNGHIINTEYNCAGICSYNQNGTIQNCYNTGKIEGNINVGGITGNIGNTAGTILVGKVYNCYSTGTISGNTSMGGIIGSAVSGVYDVKNTYWLLGTGATYGMGYANSNSNATGVNQNTLKSYATTLGTAFTADVQDKDGNYLNNGYPILKWQIVE